MGKGIDTRNAIVERAFRLVKKVGLEGLSLGVLAEDVGLSKSGLFAHFQSKEALQLAVIEYAIERYTQTVIRPAIRLPRGEPRVQALFDNFLAWIGEREQNGVCFFIALAQEYNDRPGAVRESLVQSQHDWRATIMRAASIASEVGDFRSDLDVGQFAFEFIGFGMAYQQSMKFLADAYACQHVEQAFAQLLIHSRA